MPTVSVVIPTYNRAALLSRAIDSVLAQTADDFELLVVDDGSTDDTEAVVTGYRDDRVRYIAHDTNRGANQARNTGIDAADGDFVAFLDSDDEWRPRKLEAQLDRLATDDEFVAVYCDYDVKIPGVQGSIRETAATVLSIGAGDDRVEGSDELVGPTLADTFHTGAGSTLLVRTEIAQRIGGFDESLGWFQDPDFLLRVLEAGKLAHVPTELVVRHYSGWPDADTAAAADEEFLAKHDDLVRESESRGYDVHGSHALILAKYYLREGRFRTGLRQLRRASVGPREVPSVMWFAASGGRRWRSVLFATSVVGFGAMLARRRR
ncbi:family 2 glycosyl transferase [Halovivax asiaticus JCM 14624]|uniref:Family 2 glycosyl transferase n=1 Tax=Halovivax asiaticus JCM 14624 TaxID=1227490 RepID=M0BN30_9EURY|nr:glycosyltransferase family A protein [Halovivax asiaticus]ELZ10994.1 family 2 glycosyl transferase [Halovivax asiaticus JCM 14624]